jgi:hypothetical protein
MVIEEETRMRPLTPQRWKATIDMLVLVSILASLVQSLMTGSDQPAVGTLAAVGLAWALATGVSYWLRLLGWNTSKQPGATRESSQKREEGSASHG